MASQKYIIDCDPGGDDALALMLAAVSPEIELLAVTTASGNAPAQVCAENALRVLRLCGRDDVPVYVGAHQPLSRPLAFDGFYSGENGLCNIKLPPAQRAMEPVPAVSFLVDCLNNQRNLSILSMAPLTNIALALRANGGRAPGIEKILCACGVFGVAPLPIPPRPEWNVSVDPQAAQEVFDSGILVEAIGLDASAWLNNEMLPPLLEGLPDSPALDFLQEGIKFNVARGLEPYSLLADSLAVAAAVNPALVNYVQGKAQVQTTEGPELGATRFIPGPGSVQAAHSYDFPSFIQLLRNRVFVCN